jgi:hypothetical protein
MERNRQTKVEVAKQKHAVLETSWKDEFLGDGRFYRF